MVPLWTDQEKTLHESFKLWENFASSYTNMMFEAMEQTMKQSEAFKERMDDAVKESLKAWRPPAQTDPGQVVEALQALQAQIQALTDKVDSLEKAVTNYRVPLGIGGLVIAVLHFLIPSALFL